MAIDYNYTGATLNMGRKWDVIDCQSMSPETDIFNLTSWPRGDHNDANDYSANGECYEASSTSLAEVVAVQCVFSSGSHSISFNWYDPYGRNIYSWSGSNIQYATSWIGRFGEKNLGLEIYKPGLYYVIISTENGSGKMYFNVYDQTSNKYLSKQGSSWGDGNSQAGAKDAWATAQTALAAGNNLYVMEGDYSNETGFQFSKTQVIVSQNAFGGYPNTSDSADYVTGDAFTETIMEVMNPIEADGTIDTWAVHCSNTNSPQVRLKVYRGGHCGTGNASTSTRVHNTPLETITSNGWNTFPLSPALSVLRGDMLAVYCNATLKIGLKGSGGAVGSCSVVSGDAGDAIFGTTGYQGYGVMLRAWDSTSKVITLPKF